jgi:hypothetical protein
MSVNLLTQSDDDALLVLGRLVDRHGGMSEATAFNTLLLNLIDARTKIDRLDVEIVRLEFVRGHSPDCAVHEDCGCTCGKNSDMRGRD